MKDPKAYELNGHGKIVQDTKTPELWYIKNDRDPGFYACLGLFDRVETHDGVFHLASQQDGLKEGNLSLIYAHCLASYIPIHISNVKRIFFKPGLVDQVEGEWAWEWFKGLGRRLSRRLATA